MAAITDIEWTDATWNPITGCMIETVGCIKCYAMLLAGGRLKNIPSRKGLTKVVNGNTVWTGETRFNDQWLDQPLRWTRPRKIFVVAHGDLFYEKVPAGWIVKVFAVIALCHLLDKGHIFQILTKRSNRMHQVLSDPDFLDMVRLEMNHIRPGLTDENVPLSLPLQNTWLGVSLENQECADSRHYGLSELSKRGWITFVSYEPALGQVNWKGWEFLNWLICGGESGPGSRPMHPEWARSAHDYCNTNGIHFFFKQWGAWYPVERHELNEFGEWIGIGPKPKMTLVRGREKCGYYCDDDHGCIDHQEHLMKRIGKKLAGRTLDGVVHDGFPHEAILS